MPDPLVVPDGTYSDLVFGPEYLTPAGAYRDDASASEPSSGGA